MPSSPPTGATCGQGPRPARQLRPRRPPGAGFSSSSGRSAPMTTGGGRPADGIVCTHAARKLLALGGVSRDQQAHDRGSHSSIPKGRTRGRRAAGGRPRPGPITAHADERKLQVRIFMYWHVCSYRSQTVVNSILRFVSRTRLSPIIFMAACLQIPGPRRADYLFCVSPGGERRAARAAICMLACEGGGEFLFPSRRRSG